MATTTISPFHWDTILQAIHERSCVPFLGAAVNISSVAHGYGGLPLGGDVALRLIENLIGSKIEKAEDLAQVIKISKKLKQAGLDQDLARLGFQNLPRVALHYEVQSLGNRANLLDRLKDLLADDKCVPSKILETVAQLPFSLIVTTNFDRLLERALDRVLAQSLSVTVTDFKEPEDLARELKDGPDPLSQYLHSQFSATTQQLLVAWDGSSPTTEPLKVALAEELDKVVKGNSLFEAQRFAQVTLTPQIQKLIAASPAGQDLMLLNRLLLEEAYVFEMAKSLKPYKVVVQPIDGFKGPEQTEQLANPPPQDVPVVYKIHGSFHEPTAASPGGKSPFSVIITEEDYIKFLTIVGKPGEGVPTYISSKMVRSTLLFLGYSLEDWDFRTIYKGLIEPLTADEKRTSFAIQWRPPKFWVKYWEQKGVVIYDCDVYAFAEALEKKYIAKYDSLSAVKEVK